MPRGGRETSRHRSAPRMRTPSDSRLRAATTATATPRGQGADEPRWQQQGRLHSVSPRPGGSSVSRNHGQGPVLEGDGCVVQVDPGRIGKAAQVLPHAVPQRFAAAKERTVTCMAASPLSPTGVGGGQQHGPTAGPKGRCSLAGIHTALPSALQGGGHVLQERQQAAAQQEEQQLPHALGHVQDSVREPGLQLGGERRGRRLAVGAERPRTPSASGTAHPHPFQQPRQALPGPGEVRGALLADVHGQLGRLGPQRLQGGLQESRGTGAAGGQRPLQPPARERRLRPRRARRHRRQSHGSTRVPGDRWRSQGNGRTQELS